MTIYFFLLLFLNLWVWKLLSVNILIALLAILACIFHKNKIGIFFILLLIILQIRTTNFVPFTKLSENEKVIQIRRMREYENPRIAHVLEERPEFIIFYKLQTNISQALDPNFYFFANHPRERVGVNEFEKFSYLLLPFFINGFYILVKNKKYFLILTFLIIPLTLTSIIGLNNPLGPFSLFPFIFIASYEGFIKKPIFALLYIVVFLQVLAYALA